MPTSKSATASADTSALELRIAELEAALKPQAQITGFLRNVQDITSDRPGAKISATAILSNSDRQTVGGREVQVDLPVDGLIATDNGQPLASQLLELARVNKWTRVRIGGFWVSRGDVSIRGGYLKAAGKQLRVQSITVLGSAPAEQPTPVAAPAPVEPTAPVDDLSDLPDEYPAF